MVAARKKVSPKKSGKAGRRSEYDAQRHPMICRALRSCGKTLDDIAESLQITRQTLHNWSRQHPEFGEALQMGLTQANAQVIESLFKRATGFEYEETKTVVTKDADGRPVTRVERMKKIMPPDVGACCFWLKNRESEEWFDVNDIRLKGRMNHGMVAVDEAAAIRARLESDPEARAAVRAAFTHLYPPPGKNAH